MSKIYGIPVATPIPPGGTGGGANGKSAYELAVAEGFEGTLTEWLESLEGKPGPEGPRGLQGQPGYGMVATDPNNDGNIVLSYEGGKGFTTEIWTFELEDGTLVEKEVVLG